MVKHIYNARCKMTAVWLAVSCAAIFTPGCTKKSPPTPDPVVTSDGVGPDGRGTNVKPHLSAEAEAIIAALEASTGPDSNVNFSSIRYAISNLPVQEQVRVAKLAASRQPTSSAAGEELKTIADTIVFMPSGEQSLVLGYADKAVARLPLMTTETRSTFISNFSNAIGQKDKEGALKKLFNSAPVIAQVPPVEGMEDSGIILKLQITDPENDKIALSCIKGCPTNVSIDSEKHIIRWTPDYNQSGDYIFELQAFDGLLNSSSTIKLSIANLMRPPTVRSVDAAPIIRRIVGGLVYDLQSGQAYATDRLYCDAGDIFESQDHDTVSLEYRWYRNNLQVTNPPDKAELVLSQRSGDAVRCEVRATNVPGTGEFSKYLKAQKKDAPVSTPFVTSMALSITPRAPFFVNRLLSYEINAMGGIQTLPLDTLDSDFDITTVSCDPQCFPGLSILDARTGLLGVDPSVSGSPSESRVFVQRFRVWKNAFPNLFDTTDVVFSIRQGVNRPTISSVTCQNAGITSSSCQISPKVNEAVTCKALATGQIGTGPFSFTYRWFASQELTGPFSELAPGTFTACGTGCASFRSNMAHRFLRCDVDVSNKFALTSSTLDATSQVSSRPAFQLRNTLPSFSQAAQAVILNSTQQDSLNKPLLHVGAALQCTYRAQDEDGDQITTQFDWEYSLDRGLSWLPIAGRMGIANDTLPISSALSHRNIRCSVKISDNYPGANVVVSRSSSQPSPANQGAPVVNLFPIVTSAPAAAVIPAAKCLAFVGHEPDPTRLTSDGAPGGVCAVWEDKLYSSELRASDADGDDVRYGCTSLATCPAGMTVDPVSGLITWTPRPTAEWVRTNGRYVFPAQFKISDGYDSIFINAGLTIDTWPYLKPLNNLTDASGPYKAPEAGSLVEFNLNGFDGDGDQVSYKCISGCPEGAFGVDLSTGKVTWQPDFGQQGTYNLIFEASSAAPGGATLRTTRPMTIVVIEGNRPPLLNLASVPQSRFEVNEFGHATTSFESPKCAFSESSATAAMLLDSNCHAMTFTMQATDTDPDAVDALPQVLYGCSIGEMRTDQFSRPFFVQSGACADLGIKVDAFSGLVIFSPGYARARETDYNGVFFWATDRGNDTRNKVYWPQVSIHVNNVKRPPVLQSVGMTDVSYLSSGLLSTMTVEVAENSSLSLPVRARDDDGDPLEYSCLNCAALPVAISTSKLVPVGSALPVFEWDLTNRFDVALPVPRDLDSGLPLYPSLKEGTYAVTLAVSSVWRSPGSTQNSSDVAQKRTVLQPLIIRVTNADRAPEWKPNTPADGAAFAKLQDKLSPIEIQESFPESFADGNLIESAYADLRSFISDPDGDRVFFKCADSEDVAIDDGETSRPGEAPRTQNDRLYAGCSGLGAMGSGDLYPLTLPAVGNHQTKFALSEDGKLKWKPATNTANDFNKPFVIKVRAFSYSCGVGAPADFMPPWASATPSRSPFETSSKNIVIGTNTLPGYACEFPGRPRNLAVIASTEIPIVKQVRDFNVFIKVKKNPRNDKQLTLELSDSTNAMREPLVGSNAYDFMTRESDSIFNLSLPLDARVRGSSPDRCGKGDSALPAMRVRYTLEKVGLYIGADGLRSADQRLAEMLAANQIVATSGGYVTPAYASSQNAGPTIDPYSGLVTWQPGMGIAPPFSNITPYHLTVRMHVEPRPDAIGVNAPPPCFDAAQSTNAAGQTVLTSSSQLSPAVRDPVTYAAGVLPYRDITLRVYVSAVPRPTVVEVFHKSNDVWQNITKIEETAPDSNGNVYESRSAYVEVFEGGDRPGGCTLTNGDKCVDNIGKSAPDSLAPNGRSPTELKIVGFNPMGDAFAFECDDVPYILKQGSSGDGGLLSSGSTRNSHPFKNLNPTCENDTVAAKAAAALTTSQVDYHFVRLYSTEVSSANSITVTAGGTATSATGSTAAMSSSNVGLQPPSYQSGYLPGGIVTSTASGNLRDTYYYGNFLPYDVARAKESTIVLFPTAYVAAHPDAAYEIARASATGDNAVLDNYLIHANTKTTYNGARAGFPFYSGGDGSYVQLRLKVKNVDRAPRLTGGPGLGAEDGNQELSYAGSPVYEAEGNSPGAKTSAMEFTMTARDLDGKDGEDLDNARLELVRIEAERPASPSASACVARSSGAWNGDFETAQPQYAMSYNNVSRIIIPLDMKTPNGKSFLPLKGASATAYADLQLGSATSPDPDASYTSGWAYYKDTATAPTPGTEKNYPFKVIVRLHHDFIHRAYCFVGINGTQLSANLRFVFRVAYDRPSSFYGNGMANLSAPVSKERAVRGFPTNLNPSFTQPETGSSPPVSDSSWQWVYLHSANNTAALDGVSSLWPKVWGDTATLPMYYAHGGSSAAASSAALPRLLSTSHYPSILSQERVVKVTVMDTDRPLSVRQKGVFINDIAFNGNTTTTKTPLMTEKGSAGHTFKVRVADPDGREATIRCQNYTVPEASRASLMTGKFLTDVSHADYPNYGGYGCPTQSPTVTLWTTNSGATNDSSPEKAFASFAFAGRETSPTQNSVLFGKASSASTLGQLTPDNYENKSYLYKPDHVNEVNGSEKLSHATKSPASFTNVDTDNIPLTHFAYSVMVDFAGSSPKPTPDPYPGARTIEAARFVTAVKDIPRAAQVATPGRTPYSDRSETERLGSGWSQIQLSDLAIKSKCLTWFADGESDLDSNPEQVSLANHSALSFLTDGRGEAADLSALNLNQDFVQQDLSSLCTRNLNNTGADVDCKEARDNIGIKKTFYREIGVKCSVRQTLDRTVPYGGFSKDSPFMAHGIMTVTDVDRLPRARDVDKNAPTMQLSVNPDVKIPSLIAANMNCTARVITYSNVDTTYDPSTNTSSPASTYTCNKANNVFSYQGDPYYHYNAFSISERSAVCGIPDFADFDKCTKVIDRVYTDQAISNVNALGFPYKFSVYDPDCPTDALTGAQPPSCVDGRATVIQDTRKLTTVSSVNFPWYPENVRLNLQGVIPAASGDFFEKFFIVGRSHLRSSPGAPSGSGLVVDLWFPSDRSSYAVWQPGDPTNWDNSDGGAFHASWAVKIQYIAMSNGEPSAPALSSMVIPTVADDRIGSSVCENDTHQATCGDRVGRFADVVWTGGMKIRTCQSKDCDGFFNTGRCFEECPVTGVPSNPFDSMGPSTSEWIFQNIGIPATVNTGSSLIFSPW